jgi:HAD superfamily hydrolase (TIGR01509 family)
MARFIYTVTKAIQCWKPLKCYMDFTNPWRIQQLPQLSVQWLSLQGVHHLALDFDGVMAPHGDSKPLPEVLDWLRRSISTFEGKIYILSNKPSQTRIDYFKQHFPSVIFIVAKRKKPYPDGLLQIIQTQEAKPNEVCLVDDRLLTGVLATQIAGARAVYITRPYAHFRHRFLEESFFAMLRNVERFWLA